MTGAVYLLDKGPGVTSRKASGRVAAESVFRKYGHCGTLDPDATGLLVVLLGKATRLADFLSAGEKRYSFTLVAGISTDTLDMSGNVIETADPSGMNPQVIASVLHRFTGTIQQKVPLVSAVRVGGRRGYELARKGLSPEMPERTVTVSRWKTGETVDGRTPMEVTVSSGTYVRALARDIGAAVGVPCVADSIRRLTAGEFSVEEASTGYGSPGACLSMAEAAGRVLPLVEVSLEQAQRAVNGIDVPCGTAGTAGITAPSGTLIALGESAGGMFHPSVVLAGREDL